MCYYLTLADTKGVTVVISEVVRRDRIREYETWIKGSNQAVTEFEGFQGVEVIRPADHNHPEYVIILRFDTYDDVRRWQESSTRAGWIENAQDIVVRESHIQKASGLETWFTLPDNAAFLPRPRYYKMVAISTVTVYSLIVLVETLIGPVTGGLPRWLGLLISVAIVSALLTYPVMPLVTRLFGFWLYPSSVNSKAQSKLSKDR